METLGEACRGACRGASHGEASFGTARRRAALGAACRGAAGKPSLQKPAEELSEEAQVLAATLEASLESIMEDEASKTAKKEEFLKKVNAAQKEEEAFQAWAENCVSLLTEAHQAEAASVQLTGLGSCSRCRWGTGCSSCSFPHACKHFLREELG